jgi:hypothetical protein
MQHERDGQPGGGQMMLKPPLAALAQPQVGDEAVLEG